jgi:hypothetical protein
VGGVELAIELDTSLECWSGTHLAYIVVVGLPGSVYLLGLPYMLYKQCNKIVLFDDADAHERFVRQREIEYMAGMNHNFALYRYHLISSFTRDGAYTRVWLLAQKVGSAFVTDETRATAAAAGAARAAVFVKHDVTFPINCGGAHLQGLTFRSMRHLTV